MPSRFWLLVFLLAPIHFLMADSSRTESFMDESVLFRWVVAEDRYEQVSPPQIQPKNLYLRWDHKEQRHVWVTGDNRHQILNKSKVQGSRIGYVGADGRNWFEYHELDSPSWRKKTERERPEVLRWDPLRVVEGVWSSGIYVSERAPLGWEGWGGELDPIAPPVVDPPVVEPPVTPPVKPPGVDPPVVEPPVTPPTKPKNLGCQITVSPGAAPLGSTVILTMTTTGPVMSATLNGAAVDFPLVLRALVLDNASGIPRPNSRTIHGHVLSLSGDSAKCQAVILITGK